MIWSFIEFIFIFYWNFLINAHWLHDWKSNFIEREMKHHLLICWRKKQWTSARLGERDGLGSSDSRACIRFDGRLLTMSYHSAHLFSRTSCLVINLQLEKSHSSRVKYDDEKGLLTFAIPSGVGGLKAALRLPTDRFACEDGLVTSENDGNGSDWKFAGVDGESRDFELRVDLCNEIVTGTGLIWAIVFGVNGDVDAFTVTIAGPLARFGLRFSTSYFRMRRNFAKKEVLWLLGNQMPLKSVAKAVL